MNPSVAPSSLMRFAPKPGATRRLFCIPFAGGGASAFRPWALELPPTIDVMVAQFPGRENRIAERPLSNVRAMVEHLVPAVAAHTDLPFAILGHSIGGLIAFELAHALLSDGLPGPAHLFVSATRAPRYADDELPPLHTLADDPLLDEIDRRYGGVPAEIRQHRDLLDLLLPTLRADIAALETYRPREAVPLPCPISAFFGSRDRRVTRASVEGWRHETNGGFAIREFEGDHFFLKHHRATMLAEIVAGLTPSGSLGVA